MRRPRRRRGGIPLRAILPNLVTALGLCSGLTAIRAALLGEWEMSVLLVLVAAVLDGIDGGIARLVRGETRFGAELDSLADAISFGVAPALILYSWSLNELGRFGWLVALLLALFCALRLARFNAGIDRSDPPHRAHGYLTGVPAPAGALLALTPLYLSFWTGLPELRTAPVIAAWTAGVAVLMVSSLPTFRPQFRLRQRLRFEAVVALVALAAALVAVPWTTLTLLALGYLATIPFSVRSYQLLRKRLAGVPVEAAPPQPPSAEQAEQPAARDTLL
ncbi:MAG TPA: CDP-diacylglycerol--serine O-phosphatidyltransferase [Allosphingosinicella sp.]|jgi:CDP-diacylglycerol--serine O-phosphatidyltransferase